MQNIKASLGARFIIFGRYPVPGSAKTRLIPALGPIGAADLQRRLTEKTFAKVKAIAYRHGLDIEFRFEGGSKRQMRRWLGRGAIYSYQGPGNLGKRMNIAFSDAFRDACRHVILLGTDIPGIKTEHLEDTIEALREKDIVLGPSTDGGYWLIGLKRPADVFRDISWGTETVLEKTVALSKKLGLDVHLLDPLTDIDSPDDLKLLEAGMLTQGPYISVIIPALNEEENIEGSIRSAQDDDVEIIVVDGGSTDHTVKVAIKAGAKIEKSPRGRAVQQNHGARVSQAKTLLFLHADTRLPNGFVSHVFDTLMGSNTAVGAFRFKSDLDHPLMKGIEFLTNFRSQCLRLPYGDQGLFIRKSLFDFTGGFRDLPIAEDLCFVRLLSKYGHIRIAPASVVTSARRWQTKGIIRTTLINQLIVAGCFVGISPKRLAALYQVPHKKNRRLVLYRTS